MDNYLFNKKNRKDWTSTVLKDIEGLNILNKSMNEKAIEKLSEVHLRHEIMNMNMG